MNFSSILAQIEAVDPEVYERLSPRRRVIKNWMRGVSLTALPFALGSLFQKAYGQTTPLKISDVLNFALTLEQLEQEFYQKALQASAPSIANPLIPSNTGLEQPAFKTIYLHEQAHVSFLTKAIKAMGAAVATKPTFDFTGGKGMGTGPFPTVFSDYDLFLAVAQTFEDTGVRAYKGQATALKSDNDVLTAALRIHSVEARHAAHIRLMRRQTPSALTDNLDIRPWISNAESGINSPDVQKSYDGEQNTVQGNIETVNISGFQINARLASESFDEPLTMKTILEIIDPFIVA